MYSKKKYPPKSKDGESYQDRKSLSYAFLKKLWVIDEASMVDVNKISKGGWRPLTQAGIGKVKESLASAANLIGEERQDPKLCFEGVVFDHKILLRKASRAKFICEDGNHRLHVWKTFL